MAAKETTLSELGEMLGHVVEHMATKDDLAALGTELKADIATLGEQVASIERDLKTIRRELNDLIEKVENISGYRKEIDHALGRIAAIEKRLGVSKRAPA
jgi:chromosome segregation ATPase